MNALLTFFIVLYAIVCVLLILLVIVQGGRAEGLFASAQANVLGSRGADMLTKITRVLATIFIVGALLISIVISGQSGALDSAGSSAPLGALSAEDAAALMEAEAEAERLAAEEAERLAAEEAAAAARRSSSSSQTAEQPARLEYDDELMRLSQTTAGGN